MKTIPWKFRIVNPKNSGVIYPWNLFFFIKSRLIFKIFYCFCMFVNKHFINRGAYISKSKQYHNVKTSEYYFHMRAKIPLNFCIWCICVPLILVEKFGENPWLDQNTPTERVIQKFSFVLLLHSTRIT